MSFISVEGKYVPTKVLPQVNDANVRLEQVRMGQCLECGVQCYRRTVFGLLGPFKAVHNPPLVMHGRCMKCYGDPEKGTRTDNKKVDEVKDGEDVDEEIVVAEAEKATDEDGVTLSPDEMVKALLALAALKDLVEDAVDDDAEDWPGNIQKGSYVRCVNPRGSKVSRGEIGVVKAFEDGVYTVNFHSMDDWEGRATDLQLNLSDQKIREGALVRVKPGIEPKFGWGNLGLDRTRQGFVKSVRYDGLVRVQFGFKPDEKPDEHLWSCLLHELQVLDPNEETNATASISRSANGMFLPGDAVRVKSSVSSPVTGWGSVKRGDVGLVRGQKGVAMYIPVYIIDFPSADGWNGLATELELASTAHRIRPGRRVRVQSHLERPRFGWGPVSPGSIGTVAKVNYDGSVKVHFPETRNWNGVLSELELLSMDTGGGVDSSIRSASGIPMVPKAAPVSPGATHLVPLIPPEQVIPVMEPHAVPIVFDVGDVAVIRGLTNKKHLNGCECQIVRDDTDKKGAYRIKTIPNGKYLFLKPQNLEPAIET